MARLSEKDRSEAGAPAGALARGTPTRVRAAVLLAGALLLGPPGVFAQSPLAAPPAEEILKKAMDRAKWSDEQKFEARYSYTQRSTVDELDSKENVKRHEERVHFIFPIAGERYGRLVEKDGKALTDKEARLEREREQKFRQRAAERGRKKEPEKRENDVKFDQELVSRYQWTLTGRETVNGRPAFVLSFQPQSHDLPVKRKLDRLLIKVAGRLWVDEQEYEVARVDVHLAENVAAWGGVLASVRKFFLRYEQVRLDEGAWLLSSLDGYVDGRILIKSLHLKVKEQNRDFRKTVAGAGDPRPAKP